MSDWPSDRKPEPPGPVMVRLDGPPIEKQTQQIFGAWGSGKVTAVVLLDTGIQVTYERSGPILFMPSA